jgi:RNA polymerase sigma factor (sigma-70 family)
VKTRTYHPTTYVPRGETYGNVTPEQWRAGVAYAETRTVEFLKGKPSWVDADSLQSEAFLGLLNAARLYKPELGRFITMAHYAIDRKLGQGWIIQQNQVRNRPPHSRFWTEPGHDPDEPFIPLSLQCLAAEGGTVVGGTPFEELQIAPNDTAAEALRGVALDAASERLARLTRLLSPQERRMLWERYGEERSQPDIARDYGITRQAVSKMIRSALIQVRSTARLLGDTP